MNPEQQAQVQRRRMQTKARLRMFSLAGYYGTDPVEKADRRTSMCDARAALSLALDRDCDRDGYSTNPERT